MVQQYSPQSSAKTVTGAERTKFIAKLLVLILFDGVGVHDGAQELYVFRVEAACCGRHKRLR